MSDSRANKNNDLRNAVLIILVIIMIFINVIDLFFLISFYKYVVDTFEVEKVEQCCPSNYLL
jgi:hypothetical protein